MQKCFLFLNWPKGRHTDTYPHIPIHTHTHTHRYTQRDTHTAMWSISCCCSLFPVTMKVCCHLVILLLGAEEHDKNWSDAICPNFTLGLITKRNYVLNCTQTWFCLFSKFLTDNYRKPISWLIKHLQSIFLNNVKWSLVHLALWMTFAVNILHNIMMEFETCNSSSQVSYVYKFFQIV